MATLRSSRFIWAAAIAVIAALALAGLLIARHDSSRPRAAPRTEEEGFIEVPQDPPPGPPGVLARQFHGPKDGVEAYTPEFNAAPAKLEFLSTRDGGKSWHRGVVRGEGPYTLGGVTLAQRDGVWWALIDEAGDADTGTRMFRSADGGRTWRAVARPPVHGQLAFFSPREGWLIGGRGGQTVWHTIDAGRSWTEVKVRLPPPVDHEEGIEVRHIEYALPRRRPDSEVLLSVTIFNPGGSREALLYASHDDGSSWTPVGSRH
jgi:hypothetical protein